MNLALDESQRLLVSSFEEFFARECPVSLVRETEAQGFAPQLWRKFAAMGAPGMGLPDAAGGLGLEMLELCLVAAAAGKAIAPLPFAEVAAVGRLLARYSGQQALLEQLACGEALLSLVLPGGYQRHDERALVSSGGVADGVLFLQDDALYLFSDAAQRRQAVPSNLGGGCPAVWQLGRTVGSKPLLLAEGPDAISAYADALAVWRLLTAASLQGLARRTLDIGVDYAKNREQFGTPIAAFQAIAHPLADCSMAVEGAELLVWEAAWADKDDAGRFRELCAMAFIFAAQTAQETSSVSLHTHGGYGFTEEYDIQLYYRRACALALMGGGVEDTLLHLAELRAGNLESHQRGER